jgi:2-polyprenyl-3-methyl-5-hydroxy-6-metoxy-1,4-benzoquinol methylase
MKAKWDELYSKEAYFFGTEPNDFLRERYSAIKAGGEVLCLAAGEGRNAVFLARQGFRVTAVDQSASGLKKTERLAQKFSVEVRTVQTDLAFFDFGTKQWDGVVSIWANLVTQLRRNVHRSCVEGMKPGGVFLLEDFTPMLNKTDLLEELSGLVITHAAELERELHEGSGHQGRNSVVQIFGTKPL